jgi:hypothetical protein
LALKWFQEDPSPGTQELPKKNSHREFSRHILGFKRAYLEIFRKKFFFHEILKFSRIYS